MAEDSWLRGEDESNKPLRKIDNLAVLGLTGVVNSLAYRVHEIERHLHSSASWFELAAEASGETHVANRIGSGAGPFRIDAGNDD